MEDLPKDHGSDRYGYVEVVGAPANVTPSEALVESTFASACQDCNVNLFFDWRPDLPASWEVRIAHDEGCPTYARLEREGLTNEEEPDADA